MRSAPALQELLAHSPPAPEAVRAFLESQSFPIVHGSAATVVWHGKADAVHLRHWIHGLESDTALQRVEDTELWHLTFDLPPGSRVEYKLEVRCNGEARWVRDALNPHSARDPYGENSVVQGEGYTVPAWTQPDAQARPGKLESLAIPSEAFGETRSARLYLPARYRRSRRYPLLIVHDGSDYLKYAGLKTVLDNLIHRLEIPELLVALIDSPERLREYANDRRHARFLVEDLLPRLQAGYPLIEDPRSRCLMGASFGAVAAFSTACRYPGHFGRLLLQSGSFAFTDIGRENRRGPLFNAVVEFVNEYRAAPIAVAERVYVSCGVYESLIYENRSLVPLLERTGMALRFDEARDGHNWINWRDRLRVGLSWLYPGPQMLIYE